MGTWSSPDTADKARRLAHLLERPVMASQSNSDLYALVGDDDLFNRIADVVRPGEADSDISFLVVAKVAEWLADLSVFRRPWDLEAVEILENVVASFEAKEANELRTPSMG